MINLSKLKVSLTKNGYHKVWELIKELPIEEVLSKTDGGLGHIHIEQAQARGMLSGQRNNVLPAVWQNVKSFDDESIKHLVFIAIIFSHIDLINELKASKTTDYKGVLKRSGGLGTKAYTNFVYTLLAFNLTSKNDYDEVEYDFSKIFTNTELAPLIREVIEIKLAKAGWDKSNDFFDVCDELGFNDVLSVDADTFRNWLSGDVIPGKSEEVVEVIDFDRDNDEGVEFTFNSGIGEWKESLVQEERKTEKTVVDLTHKVIQKRIYEYLVGLHGENNVGVEVDSGYGTPVDIVVNEGEEFVFYELKTGDSIKKVIRDALTQLMEYNYWGKDEGTASKLIIVSTNTLSVVGAKYLHYLRNEFDLPVFYQKFNEGSGELEEVI